MNFHRSRALAMAGALSALAVSCSKSSGPNSGAATNAPRPVRVAIVAARPMERVVTVTGSLAAEEAATLSVKVSGRLKHIPVDLGSIVKKGDLIAQVEPRDYELRLQQSAAALSQSRATVGLPLEGTDDRFDPEMISAVKEARAVSEEATANRDRILNLSRQGVVSKSELDTVESAYKVALNRFEAARDDARTRQAILAQRRAEFDLANQQLTDSSMRAPFDGAVQARLANLGEFLSAGTPVVKLVKTDPLRLRLEVPERDAATVRLGQRVRLTAEGHSNTYTGELTRVSPAIDEASRMLLVEADIRNDGSLRPGLFCRAQIVTVNDDPGLAVPSNSLITFAGLEKAITIQDGKAFEKVVTTGRRATDWIEVIDGLQTGEQVVVDPGNLRTGQAVRVAPAPAPPASRAEADSGP
jgi:RND family efflux transporter MFP subunit